jgi:glycosyltransferase involved in cell wall biosynthesis
MKRSGFVLAGNEYIKDRALKAGANRILIIPTVIELPTFKQINKEKNNKFTIGWIGSSSTTKYLELVIPVFLKLQKIYKNIEFIALGASDTLSNKLIQIIPWRLDKESEIIQYFDIGIMPLDSLNWSKGKCGYKLIQYMANKIPVIASPVGVNGELVLDYVNGFKARNESEWISYIEWYINNSDERIKMGFRGYELVKEKYTYESQIKKLKEIFYDL